MNIKKIFDKDGSLINEVAGAGEIKSARAILHAVEYLRNERRATNETRPMESPEDLTKDYRYIAGMIAAFNQVLSLPDEARRYLSALPEEHGPK